MGIRAGAIGAGRDGGLWIMTETQGIFRIESPEKADDLADSTQHFTKARRTDRKLQLYGGGR